MNYFPDKPWNVGDEFENETTGVVYRYDGTKWIPTGDSDPNLEYVAKSGDTMTGRLFLQTEFNQVNDLEIGGRIARQPGGRPTGDAANASDAYFWHLNLADCTTTPQNEVKLQWLGAQNFIDNWDGKPFALLITTEGTGSGQYWYCTDPGWITGNNTWHISTNRVDYALTEDLPDITAGAVCNFYISTADRALPYITSAEAYAEAKVVTERAVDGLATEEYVDNAVSKYVPPEFIQFGNYENLSAPGRFGLRNSRDENVTMFAETKALWFTFNDTDGNEPFIHQTNKDWRGFFSGECLILKDGVPIYRIAQGAGLTSFVILDAVLDMFGVYYLAWDDDTCGIPIGDYLGITQGGRYQIHIPSFLKY